MLDLDLLNTLVCVVDEHSFTRASERVHRTQSTVSQQVRKLEGLVGRTLLLRDRVGNNVQPTEHGELLAQYARRLLALSQEAEDALASDMSMNPVRIGVPEDFDARRMSGMLSGFVKMQPAARLETVSGMSTDLRRELAGGAGVGARRGIRGRRGTGAARAFSARLRVPAAGHSRTRQGAAPLAHRIRQP
jgi:DNA-binding transcriptional LysR family regulator